MSNDINKANVCFVIDTTGSMASFINEAQKKLTEVVKALSSAKDVDLSVGIVEYRDHPPEDKSFATKLHAFSTDMKAVQRTINALTVDGGGDECEAVYQGVADACTKMKWQPKAAKFAILVGDAPPHGFHKWNGKKGPVPNDHWPEKCPSGFDPHSLSVKAEELGITVHGIAMKPGLVAESFSAIANPTGGKCTQASSAAQVIKDITDAIGAEFETLDFDRKVFRIIERGVTDKEEIADELGSTLEDVGSSRLRLSVRGILPKD